MTIRKGALGIGRLWPDARRSISGDNRKIKGIEERRIADAEVFSEDISRK